MVVYLTSKSTQDEANVFKLQPETKHSKIVCGANASLASRRESRIRSMNQAEPVSNSSRDFHYNRGPILICVKVKANRIECLPSFPSPSCHVVIDALRDKDNLPLYNPNPLHYSVAQEQSKKSSRALTTPPCPSLPPLTAQLPPGLHKPNHSAYAPTMASTTSPSPGTHLPLSPTAPFHPQPSITNTIP